MLDRQTTWIEEDEDDEEDDDDDEDEDQAEDQAAAEKQHEQAKGPPSSFDMSPMQHGLDVEKLIAGFCGRCGKIADTCYCFWNVGALAVSASTYPNESVASFPTDAPGRSFSNIIWLIPRQCEDICSGKSPISLAASVKDPGKFLVS
jgi:hypothetical protein